MVYVISYQRKSKSSLRPYPTLSYPHLSTLNVSLSHGSSVTTLFNHGCIVFWHNSDPLFRYTSFVCNNFHFYIPQSTNLLLQTEYFWNFSFPEIAITFQTISIKPAENDSTGIFWIRTRTTVGFHTPDFTPMPMPRCLQLWQYQLQTSVSHLRRNSCIR